MLLLLSVVVQIAMLLYCYRLALERNARRLQLALAGSLPGRIDPKMVHLRCASGPHMAVHVACHHHHHGLALCGACLMRVLTTGTDNHE